MKKLLLIPLAMLFGCAPASKTIILHNMPRTLSITRGNGEADKHCEVSKQTSGCAQRDEPEDICIISLSLFATVRTFVHELVHCAGYGEEEARALSEFN